MEPVPLGGLTISDVTGSGGDVTESGDEEALRGGLALQPLPAAAGARSQAVTGAGRIIWRLKLTDGPSVLIMLDIRSITVRTSTQRILHYKRILWNWVGSFWRAYTATATHLFIEIGKRTTNLIENIQTITIQ